VQSLRLDHDHPLEVPLIIDDLLDEKRVMIVSKYALALVA
jgi:hypothetical protein